MKFRKDIQGLRAIAVLLVIFHHFFPETITGGYIGVDIFFVISGFLITNILISEKEIRGGRLLRDFYARRMRRILPIAILGILIGSLFAQFFLGPVFGSESRRDGFFALLFVANWHFNDLAVDYFTSGLPPSIFQHYWSLAVEEQFYLFWPLLIVLVRRWRLGPLMAIGVISILSMTYAIIDVSSGSNTAFFATNTRIWELGFGALLAITGIQVAKRIISTLALVSLIFVSFFFDSETGFPGAPALLVVIGTVVLLATSEGNRLLNNKALSYLGDISFSLYIWHWLLIQGARLYLGEDPSLAMKWVLFTATFAFSAVSAGLVENPIRYSTYLRVRPRETIYLGMGAIAFSILAIKLPEVFS